MKLKSCRTVNAILAGIFLALGIGLLWLIPVVVKDNGFFIEGLNAPKDLALEGLKSLYSFDFSNLLYIIIVVLLGLSLIFTVFWIINAFIAKKGGHFVGSLYALVIIVAVAAAVMAFFSLKWICFPEFNKDDPLATLLSVNECTFFHCVRVYNGTGKFLFIILSFTMMGMFALSFLFVVLYAFMDFFSLVADGATLRASKKAEEEPAEEPVEEPVQEEVVEEVVVEEPVVEEEVVVEEDPTPEVSSNIRVVPEGVYTIRDKKTREELFYQACVETGDYIVFDEVDFGLENIEDYDDVKIVKELQVK